MRFAFAHWDKAVQEREGGGRRDENHLTWRRGPRRLSAPVSVPRASASRQSADSTSIVAGVDETFGGSGARAASGGDSDEMALHALAGDALIRVAYLPDETKLAHEPGYPSPAVRDRILETGMRFEQISAAQVCDGVLSEFTTLLVPGGFAPNIERALGDAGADAIRSFVQTGGGFVGICAGAFLGSAWGLGLLPVELSDASDRCWNRGEGVLKLKFSELGQTLLGAAAADVGVRYSNGPLLAVRDGAADDVAVLATFASGLGDGPMAGSGAIVYGRCGRGAVLLASPHLEDGDDERTRAPFRNMVRLCRRATADEAGAAAPPSSAAADAARAEARARYAYTRIGVEPG